MSKELHKKKERCLGWHVFQFFYSSRYNGRIVIRGRKLKVRHFEHNKSMKEFRRMKIFFFCGMVNSIHSPIRIVVNKENCIQNFRALFILALFYSLILGFRLSTGAEYRFWKMG